MSYKKSVLFVALFSAFFGRGQYLFQGEIAPEDNTVVSLSIVEDYRKLSRAYADQIIMVTRADSLGHFVFKGDNLPEGNRIFRIHVDGCGDPLFPNTHVMGHCDQSKSILFLANNQDTLNLPKSLNGQIFCEMSSTNKASHLFMEIDQYKEEMVMDFNGFGSKANTKLNNKKWFRFFQEYGERLGEPLAELYIYGFLSDRRNETHAFYLNDLRKNSYYTSLSQRLQETYPNTPYSQLYETELNQDLQLVGYATKNQFPWSWLWSILLLLSLFFNWFLFAKVRQLGKRQKHLPFGKLTPQEKRVVAGIVEEKTNKEIASDLFISVSTVKTHINNLYKKLNVTNREDIKGLFENS